MNLADSRITLRKDGLLPDRTREEQSSAFAALTSTAQAAFEYFFPFSCQGQFSELSSVNADGIHLHDTIQHIQPEDVEQLCKQLFRCAAILSFGDDFVRAASLARVGRIIGRTHPTVMSCGGIEDDALRVLGPHASASADTTESALADAQKMSKLYNLLSAKNTQGTARQHTYADFWAEVEASLIMLRSMDDARRSQAKSGIERAGSPVSHETEEPKPRVSTNRMSIANLTSI